MFSFAGNGRVWREVWIICRGIFDCTTNLGLSLHPPETDWTIKIEPPLFPVEICSLFQMDLFNCLHTNPHQLQICSCLRCNRTCPRWFMKRKDFSANVRFILSSEILNSRHGVSASFVLNSWHSGSHASHCHCHRPFHVPHDCKKVLNEKERITFRKIKSLTQTLCSKCKGSKSEFFVLLFISFLCICVRAQSYTQVSSLLLWTEDMYGLKRSFVRLAQLERHHFVENWNGSILAVISKFHKLQFCRKKGVLHAPRLLLKVFGSKYKTQKNQLTRLLTFGLQRWSSFLPRRKMLQIEVEQCSMMSL